MYLDFLILGSWNIESHKFFRDCSEWGDDRKSLKKDKRLESLLVEMETYEAIGMNIWIGEVFK